MKSASILAETELAEIEIPLLLTAIFQRWGYDFRDYAPASLKRRILQIVAVEELPSVSALQERILRDSACMRRFIDQLTVSVTEMFRDPSFYQALRHVVIPLLKARNGIRIWHAGCATGEEAYSLAIMLHEEGLLERSIIYATDLNQTSLDIACDGIYPLGKMQDNTRNYLASGGRAEFSEYYQAGHGNAVMRSYLAKNIVWLQHNLVTDSSFNEFDLILCRNVLIYFNRKLQTRVHNLFYDSLTANGLMVLGRQESMQFTPQEGCFQVLDLREKIYQRVK